MFSWDAAFIRSSQVFPFFMKNWRKYEIGRVEVRNRPTGRWHFRTVRTARQLSAQGGRVRLCRSVASGRTWRTDRPSQDATQRRFAPLIQREHNTRSLTLALAHSVWTRLLRLCNLGLGRVCVLCAAGLPIAPCWSARSCSISSANEFELIAPWHPSGPSTYARAQALKSKANAAPERKCNAF